MVPGTTDVCFQHGMLLSGGKGLDQPISYVFMNPKDINNIVMFSITTNILTKPSKSQIVEKCQGLKLPLGSETEFGVRNFKSKGQRNGDKRRP